VRKELEEGFRKSFENVIDRRKKAIGSRFRTPWTEYRMGSLQNADIDLIILMGEATNQFLISRQARGEKDVFTTAAAIPGHRASLHQPGLAIV